jgi:hypothetical protein
MLKMDAGGSIVNGEQLPLEKSTLAEVPPLIDTQLAYALAAVRDTGSLNATTRLDPPVTGVTPIAVVLTAEPLPGEGVMVTVTLAGGIVPLGNPVPEILTLVITGGASGVRGVRVTEADARAVIARKSIAREVEGELERPMRLFEDTLYPE